jgi:antitoxin component YwqK of YwqJK toxin-antitoxin module
MEHCTTRSQYGPRKESVASAIRNRKRNWSNRRAILIVVAATLCSCARKTEKVPVIRQDEFGIAIQNTEAFKMEFDNGGETIERKDSLFEKIESAIANTLKEDMHSGRFVSAPTETIRLLDKNGKEIMSYRFFDNVMILPEGYVEHQGEAITMMINRELSHRIYYYPSGQRKAEGIHKNRKKHGPWRYFYESGRVESEGRYEQGNPIGEWLKWSEKGELIDRKIYE